MEQINKTTQVFSGRTVQQKVLLFSTALFIFNLVLKLLFIDSGDIALDEPFTLFHAQKSIEGIFEMLKDENNPPLYFLFMKGWTSLFGIGAFAARLPSVVFSSVTATLLFILGNRFWNLRTGILAGLIYTFSSFHMFYAHDARVYSLFCMLSALSYYFFFSLSQNPSSRKFMYWWIIINTLLLYSHFFGIVLIGSQFIFILLNKTLRATIFKPLVVCAITLLLVFSTYLSVLFQRFQSTVHNTPWIQAPVWSDLYTMLWRFSNVPVNTVLMIILLVALIAMAIAGKYSKDINKNYLTKSVLFLFLLPYLSIFLVSFYIPVFLDRYIIFISLLYYFSVSISLDRLVPENKSGWLILMILPLMMASTLKLNPGKKKNIQELVAKINTTKSKETALYIYPEWFDLNFVYYYRRDWFREPLKTKSLMRENSIFPILKPEHIDTLQLKLVHDVILIDATGSNYNQDNEISHRIEKFFPKKEISEIYEHLYIIHFSRPE